ncbi:MAG: PD-(D/E)XK nuclease family transposase, partial [Anaerovoracaceae bacterium]
LYYLAGMYTDGLMLGERYEKLPRCISISLLDYDFFPGREEYHAVYRLRDSEGRDLTDLWELHIIELTKALKGTPVDDWIRLFNAEREEELDMITTKNEGITEAINVLKSMSLRRPLKALFEDYMKAKRDRWDEDEYIRDEGRSEGIAIGSSTAILTILEQKGTVPADLRERIQSQKDETVLKQWLLAAASAGDIENFREKTEI